jgi:signal transduction histidine kinase
MSNDWVFAFLEDREGRIWIGTLGGGLNRFDPERDSFIRNQNEPGNPHSLSNDIVVSIIQDREGALWLATAGGLNRFDPGTETFTHYREKDGLANESVYCSVEDGQGHIWLSTNKGLSRFDPQTETFRNYDVTDGLQSNEFNGNACQVSDSEEMYFGGIDGFNAFFPDHIQDNPTVPPIVLTSFVQGGEEINLDRAIDGVPKVTFNWPDNSFEFEFAALSFARPEKNQYSYYLEGFEETWNEAGTRRYGQYTHLPGGTYTLHVKGSNNNGVWNEVGTSVEIMVVPPFWATWWFRGGVLIIVLGVVLGSYLLRVRTLEKRGRELESLVQQRTAELLQTQDALRQSELEKVITDERSRLARNLHDSVTQTIFSMRLTTEAAHMLLDREPSRVKAELDKLQGLAKSALSEMRAMIFELRPAAVTKRQYGLEVDLQVSGEPQLSELEARQLFRISQEAFNNVVKHAQTDKAWLTLRFEDNRILLQVEDQGSGFEPETLVAEQDHIGLASMQERVDAMGGILTVDSNPGQGTRVTVEVTSTDKEENDG